jgi:hypothetical protein
MSRNNPSNPSSDLIKETRRRTLTSLIVLVLALSVCGVSGMVALRKIGGHLSDISAHNLKAAQLVARR